MRLRSALVAVLAVLVTAGPASAHEDISPKTIRTGQSEFLTLTAANEASVDIVRVALRAPGGLAFGGATRSPAGWSAAATEDTITWTGGAVKPRTFESWGFEVEGADQPGTLTYKVTVAYAGGKSDEHEVDLTAVPPGTSGVGTAASSTTVTTASPAPSTSATTVAAAAARSDAGSGDDSGTAKTALVLSILALLVAAGALAFGARGRRARPDSNLTSGGAGAPGAAQDW